MAGAAIRLETQGARAVEARLAMLADRLGDLTPLMDIVGAILEVDAQENFAGEHTPEGVPWPPSMRAQVEGGKTLQDTRRLYLSITHRAGPDFAEVGSNVVYAARHQHGWSGTEQVRSHRRTMRQAFGVQLERPIDVIIPAHSRKANTPARPFLGLSADGEAEILGAAEDYLEAES